MEAATKTLRLVLVAWRPRPNSAGCRCHAFFDTPTIDPGSYHPTDMSTLWLALFDHLEISVGLGSFLPQHGSVWPTTASTMSGMMAPDGERRSPEALREIASQNSVCRLFGHPGVADPVQVFHSYCFRAAL